MEKLEEGTTTAKKDEQQPAAAAAPPAQPIRHCGFCLKLAQPGEYKVCGKCRRRAYCSKECQVADWSLKKGSQFGQGHKNWCGLEYGEEDIDWKITPIEGKGLGVVATRNIPSRYRIMVEGCLVPTNAELHPGLKDLMPEGGSILDKFNLNCLGGDEDDKRVLCVRLSRVNHACRPNAVHNYCSEFKVKVLCANHEIATGEEICISYTIWNDTGYTFSLVRHHATLSAKFNIVCPDDCECKNAENQRAIQESRTRDSRIAHLVRFCRPDEAVLLVKQVLNSEGAIYYSLTTRSRALFDGFQVGIMRRSTINFASACINEYCDLWSSILHPKSTQALKGQQFKKSPKSHPNYLLLG